MSDDSEWEAEEDQETPSDDNLVGDSESSSDTADKKPAAPKRKNAEEQTTHSKSSAGNSGRRKKLRRVNFDSEEDDELDYLPSHERLTSKGGYAHTKNSRMKISAANKGKSPWNKGKNRSESAKAKISAGVRARNHARLIVKLGKLGLTEEEWYKKKKQIKLLRERVRKAKLAVAKHMQDVEKRQKKKKREDDLTKQLKVAEQELSVNESSEAEESDLDASEMSGKATSEVNDKGEKKTEQKQAKKAVASTVKAGASQAGTNIGNAGSMATNEQQEKQPTLSIFAQDLTWTPHVFDSNDVSYNMLCPNGGPGGLICCSSCTASYSKYLSQTQSDMEAQKMAKAGHEVKELLGFTKAAKSTLAKTIKVARKKPVPMRRKNTPISATEVRNSTPKAPPAASASAADESILSFPSTGETATV